MRERGEGKFNVNRRGNIHVWEEETDEGKLREGKNSEGNDEELSCSVKRRGNMSEGKRGKSCMRDEDVCEKKGKICMRGRGVLCEGKSWEINKRD